MSPSGSMPARPVFRPALRISDQTRRGAGTQTSLSASRRFFGPGSSFPGLFYSHRLTGPAQSLSIRSLQPSQAVSAPPA